MQRAQKRAFPSTSTFHCILNFTGNIIHRHTYLEREEREYIYTYTYEALMHCFVDWIFVVAAVCIRCSMKDKLSFQTVSRIPAGKISDSVKLSTHFERKSFILDTADFIASCDVQQ